MQKSLFLTTLIVTSLVFFSLSIPQAKQKSLAQASEVPIPFENESKAQPIPSQSKGMGKPMFHSKDGQAAPIAHTEGDSNIPLTHADANQIAALAPLKNKKRIPTLISPVARKIPTLISPDARKIPTLISPVARKIPTLISPDARKIPFLRLPEKSRPHKYYQEAPPLVGKVLQKPNSAKKRASPHWPNELKTPNAQTLFPMDNLHQKMPKDVLEDAIHPKTMKDLIGLKHSDPHDVDSPSRHEEIRDIFKKHFPETEKNKNPYSDKTTIKVTVYLI